jgi:hypothetical protein
MRLLGNKYSMRPIYRLQIYSGRHGRNSYFLNKFGKEPLKNISNFIDHSIRKEPFKNMLNFIDHSIGKSPIKICQIS